MHTYIHTGVNRSGKNTKEDLVQTLVDWLEVSKGGLCVFVVGAWGWSAGMGWVDLSVVGRAKAWPVVAWGRQICVGVVMVD